LFQAGNEGRKERGKGERGKREREWEKKKKGSEREVDGNAEDCASGADSINLLLPQLIS
jgi:hypothetical protein